ncbi:MAG: ATP-binding cassette domain-containing protein [Gammaproteobacteria bacterium]
MIAGIEPLSWPVARLGEALQALGKESGFSLAKDLKEFSSADGGCDLDEVRLTPWVGAAAARLGLEAEPVEATYPEVEALVGGCAPALLGIAGASGTRFLALLPGTQQRLGILAPDLARYELAVETVRAALCRTLEAGAASEIDNILCNVALKGRQRERARRALLREFLSAQRIGGCWLIRPAGGADLKAHARGFRLLGLLTTLVSAHTLYYLLWILSWWLLGQGALEGRLDRGWLLAWGLVLLSLIPFRLLGSYAGGLLSVRAGAVLKHRLLFAAFRLHLDEVRHLGAGQWLGRVMELEVLEQMAITGGFLGLTALIELALSGLVLVLGTGGWTHLLLLVLWMSVTAWIALRYYRRRRKWTEARLTMTNDLVEGMVGHRTRLAQEARARWNEGEDAALDHYYGISRALDRDALTLQALVPRGWFIAGILGLLPAFVAGGHSGALLAVGLGGVLLAFQAFKDLADGLERILASAVAWAQIQPFWSAAARPEPLGEPRLASAVTPSQPDGPTETALIDSQSSERRPLLDARDLLFCHQDRAEPLLRGLNLRIHAGDRILLEGPSGGGKSTLAMLLAASRSPDSGLILLRGLDLQTLGAEAWRRRVLIVPQFHENHVFMGSFAFNALMGRGWPPCQRDLKEAEQVCRGLGLGLLLERMPAGLQQLVGETGWQLSHGERSRLYIARGLLQSADLLILDESFAALDPHTLRQALDCVLDRGQTLIVIAHP